MKLILLISLAVFLMSAKSCNTPEIKGDVYARVYPSKGIARIRTVQNTCPTQLSAGTNVPIESLEDDGCWIPKDQCQRYEREYSANACK